MSFTLALPDNAATPVADAAEPSAASLPDRREDEDGLFSPIFRNPFGFDGLGAYVH